ncbi:CHRD domain-containing protein [Pleurocapsales cyanobacterium LEGE 06147]|nr:CHRD domain-containing protein [Pleurocapsales cyanobacterium LEGE 06147]
MTHPESGENVFRLSPTTPSEVEDYLLTPRDNPERPAVYASGDVYTFLATSRETDFSFNFFDFFLPVNGGPPPHYHPFEHETWFVTAGEIQYNLGNQGTDSIVVPEGSLIFGPRNRVHGYQNLDSTASISGITPGARTLSLTTPGALDLFFDAISPRVINRDDPIPAFNPTDEDFLNIAEFSIRTGAGISFPSLDYEPPAGTFAYGLVLPEDAEEEVVEQAKALAKIDGFKVWTIGDRAGLPKRPTFTGPFGYEYTSLASFEETGIESSYNQFSLAPQATDTFVRANLIDSQVVEPTHSSAIGVANLELNEAGEIEYSLKVTDLDFGELVEGETAQTPDNELDDVTGLHIHAGERGSNGEHVFSILDPNHQDETDPSITINKDGSATISGTWNQTEKEIPSTLKDFFSNGGLPGQETDFYFQVHTEGNPEGEIRGQIAHTTDDFPDPIKSKVHEAFYVREGTLSFKINDEVRLAGPDTFVYVAPGNEYSVGNFGEIKAESLVVSVFPQTDDEPIVPDDTDYNPVYGSEGDDLLLADRKDKLVGGEGNDTLKIASGGDNLLYGGPGADRFWIADGQLPDTVPETRQTNLPPPFPPLPPLEDTKNTIVDFEQGIDTINIRGIEGISSFDDLKLLPAFGDLQSTSILATVDGIDGEISLANVSGVVFNEFSADDFVFA